MSEQNTQATGTQTVGENAKGEAITNDVFTDDRGQYTVGTFKLNKTNEILDRFRGDHTITYRLPAPGETVEQTLANIRAVVAEDADFSQVLVGKFNGQGLNLDVQKRVKDYLGAGNIETTKGMSVEEALAGAQKVADEFRLTNVRTRAAAKATTGKIATAVAAAKAQTAIGAYRLLPLDLRAQYRERLLALGGITAEEMDAADAEDRASAEAPEAPEGGHSAGSNRRGR